MHRAGDVLLLVGAVLAGAVAGTVGSFLQAATVQGLPAGLLLALALSAAVVGGAGRLAGSTAASVLALVGWLGAALWVSAPRPEGDLVVLADGHGYTWLYGGAVGLTAVAVLARRRTGPRLPRR